MKSKGFKIVCLILFNVIFIKLSVAQNVKGEKEMTRLELTDSSFVYILDELIEKMSNCNYYTKSLIWEIYLNNYKDTDSILIKITLSSSVAKEYEYFGYFYHDNHMYTVGGNKNLMTNFFKRKEKTKLTLTFKNSILEDYPVWYYIPLSGGNCLKKEYFEPCNEDKD